MALGLELGVRGQGSGVEVSVRDKVGVEARLGVGGWVKVRFRVGVGVSPMICLTTNKKNPELTSFQRSGFTKS